MQCSIWELFRVGSARVGSGRLTCDYNAISVQLQLQLPTGTELGNIEFVLVGGRVQRYSLV